MAKDRRKNRPAAHNFIDLTGQRFGRLVVVEDTGMRKSRRPIWKCICDCGKIANANGKYLLCGDTKSCGCLTLEPSHNRDMVGEISMSSWTPILKNASVRGIPFEVSRDYCWNLFIQQGGKCKLSGVPLTFTPNVRDFRKLQNASLDRINSSKGYIEGNLQWVHKRLNIMKSNMSDEEFVEWCRLVSEHNLTKLGLAVVTG